MFPRKVKRKSQKLFPFVKMEKNIEVYPYTLSVGHLHYTFLHFETITSCTFSGSVLALDGQKKPVFLWFKLLGYRFAACRNIFF